MDIKFRTELQLPKSAIKVSHSQKILTLGSCFADTIGNKLVFSGFDCTSNPLGTVYNPLSISKLIRYCSGDVTLNIDDMISTKGIYNHPDFHSEFGDLDQESAYTNIVNAISETLNTIQLAEIVFVTLGTSIAYWDLNSGLIVSNCHKRPNSDFAKVNIDIAEGVRSLTNMCQLILNINPASKIVFTLSPVRHIKDGIIENARSKARCLLMIDQLNAHFEDKTSYFPAYEFIMDDLRDYRYYENDLIHPNAQGIQYIWNKFCDHYFDETTISTMADIESVRQGLAHRPFNPDTNEHIDFVVKLNTQIRQLKAKYSHLQF
jgi:GSCFA family